MLSSAVPAGTIAKPHWALRVALADEIVRDQRILRLGSAAGTLFILLGLYMLSFPASPGALPILVLLTGGVLVIGAIAAVRHRRAALNDSALTLFWMARRGLLDVDGRPTTRMQEQADDLDSEELLAVGAYEQAAKQADRGEPWLPVVAGIASRVDMSRLRVELGNEARARRLRLPAWAWVVVGPFALVGAGLIVLTFLGLLGLLGPTR